jgi:hypothetical protein
MNAVDLINNFGSTVNGLISVVFTLVGFLIQIFVYLIVFIVYLMGWLFWILLHPILFFALIECYCIGLAVINANTEENKLKKPFIAITTFINTNINIVKTVVNGIVIFSHFLFVVFQGFSALIGGIIP